MDNAINQANSTPGLTVIRDADYQTTKNSDDYTGIDAWQDDTKGLYSRETDAINTAIAKQKQNNDENQANHDRAKLNGSTGDHGALDNTINQANSTPGLTVNRDGDYETTKNSDDYTGIGAWQDDTKGLYSRETDAINRAIAQQKQYNNEYQSELNRLNEGAKAQIITTDSVSQAFKLGNEPNAKSEVTVLNNHIHYTKHDLNTDLIARYDFKSDINPYTTGLGGNLFQITFTNLQNSTYKGSKISKIVETVSDSTPTGNTITAAGNPVDTNGTSDEFFTFWGNPVDGDWHSTDITVSYQYYDANGNLINFAGTNDAWLSIGSLNYDQGPADRKSGVSEGVKAISGTTIKQLAGSSVTVHNDGWAYCDWDNYNGSGLNDGSWDSPNSSNAYYGAVVFQLNGTSASIRQGIRPWGGANIANDSLYHNRRLNDSWTVAATTLPQTKLQRKTSTVSYHYNKLNVNNIPDKTTAVHYHYNKLNVNSVPDKSTTVHYHYDVLTVYSNYQFH